MTGLSAHHFGLHDRGRLAVGMCADVCVFDPVSICDAATFEQPTTPAEGIHFVLVNGVVALSDRVPSGLRAGRVLLRQHGID
jgi:N-acyl-D-amino-acid deacylase